MSRILVTGSLGFIGKSLVKELENRGHMVWGCDLVHSSNARYYRCDISNYRQLEDIFIYQDFDFVYNLATENGKINGEIYYDTMYNTNIIGLSNLIRLKDKYKFKLIHISDSLVYGDYKDVLYEDVLDKYPVKQLSDYAISKRVNELQIYNESRLYNIETVIVRPFSVYGVGEEYNYFRGNICKYIYNALNDLPYTVNINEHKNYIYIDDCVRALATICEAFKSGEIYNIASDEVFDTKLISDLALKYTGKSDAMVTYTTGEEINEKVDIAKARRDLGLKTTVDIEEGIRKTVDWMRTKYER